MARIPTAEELLDNKFPEFEHLDNGNIWVNIENIMIEFAKLHVEAALKNAALEAHTRDIPYTDDVEVDEDSILMSYPLENIK